MFVNSILSSVILAMTAVALPTSNLVERQYSGAGISCSDTDSYSIDTEETIWGSVQAASGQLCTSSESDNCTVSANWSQSFGVIVSAGASLDFSEIFSINTSVSYTITNTKGTSIGETCPKGGYVCGLTYQINQAHVTGKKSTHYANCGAITGQLEKEENFDFMAPVVVNSGPEGQYNVCISSQSKNQDTASVGIPSCPGGV